MAILLVLAALSFAGSLVLLAETVTPSARRRMRTVAVMRRLVGTSAPSIRRPSTLIAAAERIGARVATPKLRNGLPQRLAAAGLAGRVSPDAFVALRLGVGVVAALTGLCLGTLGHSGTRTLLFTIALGVLGFELPAFVLERRATARRKKIHDALPSALDLLAVTVEAGLGLFGAIERLVATTDGPLSDEFALVLTELRVGDSTERALKRMSKRLNSPDITSFVRALIQGEQLGLSLGQTLRNLAEDVRRRRRAAAEELAAKAPVKMLIPTSVFIFPALFVVILGPAVLELRQYL